MVVDADCLIAGTLAVAGAAFELVNAWEEGEFELIVCPRLTNEVRKALLHPRIAGKYGIRPEEVESLARRLSDEGLPFDDPQNPSRVVPKDPDDDYLIALALSAHADLLVTRDQHFAGVKVKGLPIVTPRQALRQLRIEPG